MELDGGAQVSLTSVWHQLLERPSLRRLEVICEHAFFTLEHDVMGPVTWTRPGEQGSLEGGELFSAVAERHDGRSPNQDAGFVEAVASGVPGPHPDFATALRAHEVVDGIYRCAAAGGAPVGRQARPDPARMRRSVARVVEARELAAGAGTPSCRDAVHHQRLDLGPVARARPVDVAVVRGVVDDHVVARPRAGRATLWAASST